MMRCNVCLLWDQRCATAAALLCNLRRNGKRPRLPRFVRTSFHRHHVGSFIMASCLSLKCSRGSFADLSPSRHPHDLLRLSPISTPGLTTLSPACRAGPVPRWNRRFPRKSSSPASSSRPCPSLACARVITAVLLHVALMRRACSRCTTEDSRFCRLISNRAIMS